MSSGMKTFRYSAHSMLRILLVLMRYLLCVTNTSI